MYKNPNNDPNMLIVRFMAGLFSSTVMAFLLIGILYLTPRPLPPLETEAPSAKKAADGVYEKDYWIGTLRERLTYKNGIADGPVLHYYPNGSLYRQLSYSGGRLNGQVQEFYEMPRRGRRPGMMAEKGFPKAIWHYRDGKRHGPYRLYHSHGHPREEGAYADGRREGTVRTWKKDGTSAGTVQYAAGRRI